MTASRRMVWRGQQKKRPFLLEKRPFLFHLFNCLYANGQPVFSPSDCIYGRETIAYAILITPPLFHSVPAANPAADVGIFANDKFPYIMPPPAFSRYLAIGALWWRIPI